MKVLYNGKLSLFIFPVKLLYHSTEPLITLRGILPAKVLYDRFADGRDDGLGGVDPNSSAAFDDWYKNRRPLGHPWEVCRGGNSTHISLYVTKSDKGYYLGLSGSSWSRSIETIKFYLALRKCGVAVCLYRAKEITDRLLEKDLIGIVPMRMTPTYCDLHFPGYKKRFPKASACACEIPPVYLHLFISLVIVYTLYIHL